MPNAVQTVLLAEDDQYLRQMYVKKLEQEGFSVVCAADGQKAIEAVKKNKPGLALVDIIMPRKDGFEVLEEIRADPKLKSLPVILLTNLSEAGDIRRAKKLGANEYIIKSHFLPSEVIGVIRKYI